MAVRDLALSRGASTLIFDPNLIRENLCDNTRDMDSLDTLAHIREMAEVIKLHGNDQFPPITIYQVEDDVFVMAGWCRRRAHILAMEEGAPIKGILCLTAPRKKQEDITLSILTSNDGLPLTAMEKAAAVKRLQSFLWTPQDIAERTGWSITTINNLIALHDAPDEITGMVTRGEVSPTLATNLMKAKGPVVAAETLADAVKSAKKVGKSKATAKDLYNIKKKNVNWKVFGPKLYDYLKAIYETPVNKRDDLMQRIADTGDLLAEIEELIGTGLLQQ